MTSPADRNPAGLHLIDLDQDRRRLVGQRRFISCWTFLADELSFIVDPGPPSTGSHLVFALESLGCVHLDFILLTHIHLDHAGTTASVLERWPTARVVCHPRGRAHLADPGRLWRGSLDVLRDKARAYGEPSPVPAESLAEYGEAAARGIQVIETPGHAPHHISFLFEGSLILGEAAGTYSSLGRGSDTDRPYLRPATPPRFEMEVAQASLDRLLALAPEPERLLFAHHGMFAGDVPGLLKTARGQLGLWVDTCREVAARRGRLAASGEADLDEDLRADLVSALAERDPYFARVRYLPRDIQDREEEYTRQTLLGVLGYLSRK